jgi:VWFA-related protein
VAEDGDAMSCFLSGLLILASGVGGMNRQEPTYSFTVDVDKVLLDVYVGRRGQPVTGLRVDDFEVFDNGVRQDVELLDARITRLNTLLLLDISRSVQGEKYQHLSAAVRAFLEGLAARDEAALVTFNHHVQMRSGWSQDRRLLSRAPEDIVGKGGTSLNDALYAGLKLMGQSFDRPTVLLFTDGQDVHSRLTESEVLITVKESSAVVYVVGIAPAVESKPNSLSTRHQTFQRYRRQSEFLREVAKMSGGKFLDARSSTDLEQTFLSILSEMKDRYLLSFSPQGVPRDGWHELKVELKNMRAELLARRGYYAGSLNRPPPR